MQPTLYAKRGDDVPVNLVVKDSSGTVVDITGYTFYLTVKSEYDTDDTDAAAVVSKFWTSHDDAANGETSSTFSVDTAGEYVFDIQMKDSSDAITTVTVNNLVVVDDVTRRTS